jgi:DNA recombination protein RmuC
MSAEILAGAGLAVSILSLVVLTAVYMRVGSWTPLLTEAKEKYGAIDEAIARGDRNIRDELTRSREESSIAAREMREEVTASFVTLTETLRKTMVDLGAAQKSVLDGFAAMLGQAKQESAEAAQGLRTEVTAVLTQLGETVAGTMTTLSQAQAKKLDEVTRQIAGLTDNNDKRQEALKTAIEAKLTEIRTETSASTVQHRDEITRTLKSVSDTLGQSLTRMSETQHERLAQITASMTQLSEQQRQQQETLRTAVEVRLDQLREGNDQKLEQMRVTVDEKLQGTLEKRLGATFKMVSDQLEQVHKNVGEMRDLAAGVGDLKRVLTNVRSRGTWGEVVLGTLLEQVLTKEQFGINIEVVPGSNQRVEFAIKLPGGVEGDGPLWLPIDSKFPNEAYDRLSRAAEGGDVDGIERASNELEVLVRSAGKDIRDKYLRPPYSTDFGLLFLPTEGLYAEIVRRPNLVDVLQRDYRVMVAGPTTLHALLNSLRMGFRTLAIQKRSSEVWHVLAAVKAEFSKYAEVMDRVKKRLVQATDAIDDVAVRQRALDRKLRGVETLPESEAAVLLVPPTAAQEVEETVL